MYTIAKQNGHTSYGSIEFICDTELDVQDLPIECKAGSSALVIETSNVYMLNNKHEWKKL